MGYGQKEAMKGGNGRDNTGTVLIKAVREEFLGSAKLRDVLEIFRPFGFLETWITSRSLGIITGRYLYRLLGIGSFRY